MSVEQNEGVYYVPLSALLAYIGTAVSERMKKKDDIPFRYTLLGCESTL